MRYKDKLIQYDVFLIIATTERKIASLPILTLGKETEIGGGVEHHCA